MEPKVWRCYHVWGQNLWVCAVPILMIMASASKVSDISILNASTNALQVQDLPRQSSSQLPKIRIQHSRQPSNIGTGQFLVSRWLQMSLSHRSSPLVSGSYPNKHMHSRVYLNLLPRRYLERQIKDLPDHRHSLRYRKVLALVIESGAIYSSALVIEITLYFLNTNAFYIVYDPIAQLTVSHTTFRIRV